MKPLELSKNNVNDEYSYENSCRDLSLNNSVNEVYKTLRNNYDNNGHNFFQAYDSEKRNVPNIDIINNQDMKHTEINISNDNTFMPNPKKNIDNINVGPMCSSNHKNTKIEINNKDLNIVNDNLNIHINQCSAQDNIINYNEKVIFNNEEKKYDTHVSNITSMQNSQVVYEPEQINKAIDSKVQNLDNKNTMNELHFLINDVSTSKQNISNTNNILINPHIEKNIKNDNQKINDDYIGTRDFIKTSGVQCDTNLVEAKRKSLPNASRLRKNEERDRGVLSRILRKI